MKSQLISVIVPVYNIENYIHKCIDSICNQTYKNLEIILVNDGSTDKSGIICDEFANRDKRIKVIHKNNGGLSDARNIGIKIAGGEFISFVDGDDYLCLTAYEELITEANKSNSDIVIFQYMYDFENAKIQSKMYFSEKECNMSNIQALKILFTTNEQGGIVAWNKLYRKKIFIENNIEFPYGKLHEDYATTYKTFYYCNKISYYPKALYYYVQREGSITKQIYDEQHYAQIEAAQEILDFIIQKNIPLFEEAECAYISANLNLYNSMILYGGLNPSLVIQIRNNICEKKYIRNKYLSKRNKFFLILLLCIPGQYSWIYKTYNWIKYNYYIKFNKKNNVKLLFNKEG